MNGTNLDLPKRESSLPFIDTGPVPGGVRAPSGDGPVVIDTAGARPPAYPNNRRGVNGD
jgi:hypothetical protein